MSETEKRKIKVFIASPNDLAEERRKFRSAIDVLNIGFGDGANVEFIPLGWEDTLASTGRRSQGVINQDIDSCDVFILAMHRRWGQDAPDAEPYSSYTEEEFHRALERWKSSSSPEIFVFFKRVDAASEADAGPQLSKVIEFRKQLEEKRQTLYRYFDSPDSFFEEIDTHLRAYAKGELPKAEDRDDAVVLPIAALQEVEKAKQLALQKTEEARQANDAAEASRLRMEEIQLEMAEVAAKLSKEGKIEFAREKFTKLVAETANIRILFLAYEFYKRTGDLDSAIKVLEKWLSLSAAEKKVVETAAAIGRLGNLYYVRGDFDQAVKMYQRLLAVNDIIDIKDFVADVYNNLANIYETQGLLGQAEEMYNKVLAIQELIGYKDGIAHGNIGILYLKRGQFEQAEEKYMEALAIEEALGHKEGIANQYGNLGNLYLIREDLSKAEDNYQKALEIYEALGDSMRMAKVYSNIGNIYAIRDDLVRAKEMYKKALAIDELIGYKEGLAGDYGNLGVLYQAQGDQDRAELMLCKSLAINKLLGCKEGTATNYSNLGELYQMQNDFGRAMDMYEKSIALFREIGSPKGKHVEELLQELRDGKASSEDSVKA